MCGPNSGWFSDRSVCYLASGAAGRDDGDRVQPLLSRRAKGSSNIATATRRAAAIERRRMPTTAATAAPRATIAAEYFGSDPVISELMAELGF